MAGERLSEAKKTPRFRSHLSPAAQAYYRKHYKKMNAGAVVVWQYAFDPAIYVDALEKAMHWYFSDREAFWCELMNQPDQFNASSMPSLLAHVLAVRHHHLQQHLVPADAEYMTAHADYSKAVLWFEVRAWAQDSTSWTIDYGTWPDQKRAYFTQASARHRIDDIYKKFPTHEIRIMAAMADLFRMLFDRQFQREDGSILRLNIAGIDANDETEAIKEGIRKAGLTGRLWPMHSRSFRAKTPLNEMAKKEGDVIGENWRRRKPTVGSMRYITYDTDAWKTHHRDRLIMPSQVPGSLT
ncbi:MAG: terminase gpA endonuclease subunit [Fuerstiella sp.]